MYIVLPSLNKIVISLLFTHLLIANALVAATPQRASVRGNFPFHFGIPGEKCKIQSRKSPLSHFLYISNTPLSKSGPYGPISATLQVQAPVFSNPVLEVKEINENTKHRIEDLSTALLDDNLSKFDFTKRLADIGRSVYSESPALSIFKSAPEDINLLKTFNTSDIATLSSSIRDYFVTKSPRHVDYKLIGDCTSTIYLSVYLDDDGFLYIDGVSSSLIYKGILSILISLLNSKKYKDLDLDSIKNSQHFQRLKDFAVISSNPVDTILNHIRKECESQSTSKPKVEKPYVPPTSSSRKRVAALLSGGVDSSLTLWILKNRGFDVEAFFLNVSDLSEGSGLCSSDDIKYAMEVCKVVGATLHVLPFSEIYKAQILDDFLENYRIGETPNPDVLCNSRVKFGEFLKKARHWGFDFVASGHYASLHDDVLSKEQVASGLKGYKVDSKGRHLVKRLSLCNDLNKDQTYFLSRLNQEQLSRLMFPLGEFKKTQVRDFAKVAKLPSFNKKDSVGLCFLEDLNISAFLSKKLGVSPGPIVEYGTNQVIGEHSGLYNYTIGQRKNLNQFIFREFKPNTIRYVVKKDLHKNTLYVTANYNDDEFAGPKGFRSSFKVTDLFWNSPDYSNLVDELTRTGSRKSLRVKLRHSPSFHNCEVDFKGPIADVFLESPDTGISTGQYCVFYLDNYCIGSGKMITNEI